MLTRRLPCGFSLIELLLVLAILATLAAIVQPIVSAGRQTSCSNNVRQQLQAIQVYQQHHDGLFPEAGAVWAGAVAFPPKALRCPTYGLDKANGYAYNQWLSGKLPTDALFPSANLLPVMGDSALASHLMMKSSELDARHSGKATIGWADGHISLEHPASVAYAPFFMHEFLSETPNLNFNITGNQPKGWNAVVTSGYWYSTGWIVNPPPTGWESSIFSNTANVGGWMQGAYLYSSRIGLAGYEGYGNFDTETEFSLRIPVTSTANTMGPGGKWTLHLPKFVYAYAGARADMSYGVANPELGGYVKISVLDPAYANIAAYTLELSGSTAVYRAMGGTTATLTTVNNALEPNTAPVPFGVGPCWFTGTPPAYTPKRYRYIKSCDTHSMTMTGTADGNVTVSYASATAGLAGSGTVAAGPGDITRPTWVELRVSKYHDGGAGYGNIMIYNLQYGGGIWWAIQ